MTTDLIKLRELAGKAAHDMTVKKYTSSLNISEFEIAATPPTIISIIDALEAANKRIAELETVNSNMKDQIRRGRQIIADLEECQE